MSANRVLIATIKNLGKCPCPRCLVQLAEVRDLGKVIDRQRRVATRRPTPKLFRIIKRARDAIFKGFKVSGSRVERLLEGGSRVAVNVGQPVDTPPVLLIDMGPRTPSWPVSQALMCIHFLWLTCCMR